MVPLVGSEPVHAPLAVHESALVVDQERSGKSPLTVVSEGDTEMTTVGLTAAVTVSVVDVRALPPGPVQVNVYVMTPVAAGVRDRVLSGAVSTAPDQEPLAVHAVRAPGTS
jgi:hypothetical protein